jgi:hypothetical protein
MTFVSGKSDRVRVDDDRPSVERIQQSGTVGGDEVDHIQFQCFGLRDGHAVADGIFSPFHVPFPFFRNGADERRGIVRHFTGHDGIHLALRTDGMRCADIRSRCHDGDMRCHGDEDTSRCGS